MRRTVHIDELHEHIASIQQALLLEKADILDLVPPERVANREEYAFSYVRAERFGLMAIRQRSDGLAHFPLHMDPAPEMLGKKRRPMNRWIMSYAAYEPDATDFGNDFMHVVTRSALRNGWNSPAYLHTISRIARLFQDLACLLNAAYFLTLLVENDIECVALNLSDDILQTANDMARIVERPEVYVLSRGHTASRVKVTASEHQAGKKRPYLRVVHPGHNPYDPSHQDHPH